MTLYVIRHGIAEAAAPGGDDAARQLTPRGRTRTREAARGLRALRVRPDALLTSPMVRAAETAAILAEVLEGPAPREVPGLAQGVAPADTLRALRPFTRHERIAIVGHEPGLSALMALLLTGSPSGIRLELRKSGAAALELDGLPPHAGATLRWLLAPRQLRRLG